MIHIAVTWLCRCACNSGLQEPLMYIASLEVFQFRNLKSVKITPHKGVNLIHGSNASGKTSLLEAISLLSTARSFRTTHIRQVIQHNQAFLRVTSKLGDQDAARFIRVGIEKSPDSTTIRVNGETVKQVSSLTSLLPMQLINPDVHKLLEQGPKYRRQFLDWGVFHVEHNFFSSWQRFYRVLKQRNSALRSKTGKKQIQLWDKQLIMEAESLNRYRQDYLAAVAPLIKKYVSELLGLEVTLHYQQGWPKDTAYSDALAKSWEQDQERGFTRNGPHRADLTIKHNGHDVQTIFSRGQQKMLVSAMRLAQVAYLHQKTAQTCVLLVDDLPAELDEAHRQRFFELLLDTEAQLFVTATEADLVKRTGSKDYKMFHVEHGEIKEVVQ